MRKYHVKNFQAEQYKRADERIHLAAYRAKVALFMFTISYNHLIGDFKRYQII